MTKFELNNYKLASNVALKLKNLMEKANIDKYYVAGGCFQKIVHDYDIFPIEENDFNKIKSKLSDNIVFLSKNAITINYEDKVVQFCKYHHNSLKELVDSFDFAHCQIGAKIENSFQVVEVYCSQEYIDWKLTDEDYYTGTEFPLSSLMRTFKYREKFLSQNYKSETIKIIVDIIKRGFKNYDDFKNQLDAIDLAYVNGGTELNDLFELLRKDK